MAEATTASSEQVCRLPRSARSIRRDQPSRSTCLQYGRTRDGTPEMISAQKLHSPEGLPHPQGVSSASRCSFVKRLYPASPALKNPGTSPNKRLSRVEPECPAPRI